MGSGRGDRPTMPSGRRVLLVAVGIALVLSTTATAIGAADPAPPSSTTPPTAPESTEPPTSTAPPVSSTAPAPATTTTAPPTPPGPAALNPSGEGTRLTPTEASAVQQSFLALTQSQRALLRRLQDARDDLAARRIALVTSAHEVAQSTERLSAARAAAASAAAQAALVTGRVRAARRQIARLGAAAYRNDPTQVAFDAAINTSDPIALHRVRTYADANSSILDARVAKLEAQERHVVAVRVQARDARDEAERLVAEVQNRLAAQRRAAQDADTAAADAQTAVVDALGAGTGLLSLAVDPHFGADAITAALAVAQADQPDPGLLLGRFAAPIPGAPLGSPYGLRVDPLTGAAGYHPGIDFEASAGTPIRASGAGVVVVAGDCGGYGNCVVIDHGTSVATLYGHQQRVLAQVGDRVTQGQVIGLVGSTGLSTGPHLHFEVRVHGAPVDPVLAISA